MKSTETTFTDREGFISKAGQLESLLREQLTLARRGNIAKIEILAKRSKDLVEQIGDSKFLKEPQFRQRRRKLEDLYSELCLALSSQMNDVSQELGKIYKGKKTVTLYRDNV